TVIQNFTTITAANQNADVTYQWVNCDNGNTPINGANSVSYTPSETGNYAVIVTEQGCSETSECILIDFTSLKELNGVQITVYPNPTNGVIHILSNGTLNESISVFELNVRKILTSSLTGTSQTIDLGGATPGVYLVRIGEQTFRVVRQ
ncbi:MAG: T9SS type A sorting domain-containing protein, partial [Bacteroidota bacterium]